MVLKNNEPSSKRKKILITTKKKLALSVANSIINSLFIEGLLTEDDLKLSQNELNKKVLDLVDTSKNELVFSVDHRLNIIKQADLFLQQEEHEFAKILYATFFEHSLNRLISHECKKRKIEENTLIEIIKQTNIHSKLTWLLKLLNLPTFNNAYIKIIKKLSDDRNAFIHYKWKSYNDDDIEKSNIINKDDEFKQIKRAVKYMKRYESHILFRKNKTKLGEKLLKK